MCEMCTHGEDERALVGTWIVDKFRKAIDMGYTVLRVYEFYEYAVAPYDLQARHGGLFVE